MKEIYTKPNTEIQEFSSTILSSFPMSFELVVITFVDQNTKNAVNKLLEA